MEPIEILHNVLLGAALLQAALGVPLIGRRVPRNRWYGFRSSTTLSDDSLWFPVNVALGWALFWTGVVEVLLCLAWIAELPGSSIVVVLVAFTLSGPVLLLSGARKLRQLERQAPAPDKSLNGNG